MNVIIIVLSNGISCSLSQPVDYSILKILLDTRPANESIVRGNLFVLTFSAVKCYMSLLLHCTVSLLKLGTNANDQIRALTNSVPQIHLLAVGQQGLLIPYSQCLLSSDICGCIEKEFCKVLLFSVFSFAVVVVVG